MTINLSPKWIQHFYAKAVLNEYMSKLPTKCGAELVDPIRKVSIGSGFNGFPSKIHDTSDRLNPDNKFWRVIGIHAEMNAILHSLENDLSGKWMFVTRYPCTACLTLMSQAGIKTIVSPSTPEPQDPEELKRFNIRKTYGDFVIKESGMNWIDVMKIDG
jgi:deoxycytidylate deaminase